MSVNEQINHLNSTVRCKLAPSKIDGVGVFAIRDIKKGDRVYCRPEKQVWCNIPWGSLSKLFPEVEEIVKQRWASIVNGSDFLSPNSDTLLILYMNHSNDPNYDVMTDTALADIKAGEEVTEDYCIMTNANKVFPNLCPL